MSRIVDFLEERGTDSAGRRLAEVLAFDDAALERHHDFIQWLFPLAEASGAVPGSPVLDARDVAVIRASVPAQRALEAAASRMRRFYEDRDHWLGAHDHNHLRITRIIRSLRLLVDDAAADAFRASVLKRVEAADAPVNATTRGYWDAA